MLTYLPYTPVTAHQFSSQRQVAMDCNCQQPIVSLTNCYFAQESLLCLLLLLLLLLLIIINVFFLCDIAVFYHYLLCCRFFNHLNSEWSLMQK